jgi:serine protease Do
VGELQEEGEKKVASAQDKEKLGLTVQPMTPQLAESLGLKRADGVVITAVEPGSPGGEAGLQKGDIILEINRVPVRNLADYSKAVANIKTGKSTLFFVQRAEGTMFLTLKL